MLSKKHKPIGLTGNQLRSILKHPLSILFILVFVVSLFALWRIPLPMERVIPLNIGYTHLDDNLFVWHSVVETVELRIQGPRRKIETLDANSLYCDLDLASKKAGLHSLPISIEQIGLPAGVEIISIAPSTITLKIEEKIKRRLPIVIQLEGQTVSSKQISQINANPPSLVVEGPQSILAELNRIVSKPLNIQGANESIQREVALDLPEGLIADDDRRLTMATIVISDVIHRRQYSSIPVRGVGANDTYEIIPPTIDLEVKGPAESLASLQTGENLKAFVKLAGLQPGVYVRRASIQLPVGVRLLQATPERFTINIGRHPAQDNLENASAANAVKLFGMRSSDALGD
jgi:YbbR domain-containing protein